MNKEYAVLSAGGGITVVGADMAPGAFSGVARSAVTFVNCDFAGKGNIKLSTMSGATVTCERNQRAGCSDSQAPTSAAKRSSTCPAAPTK